MFCKNLFDEVSERVGHECDDRKNTFAGNLVKWLEGLVIFSFRDSWQEDIIFNTMFSAVWKKNWARDLQSSVKIYIPRE